MGLRVTTAAASLPVTLAELQAEIIGYVASTAEDALLTDRLYQATEWVQNATARQLISATLVQTFDSFPCGPIKLDLQPIVSVSSVKYYAADTLTTLAATGYWTDIYSRPPRIVAKNGWPSTDAGRPAAVEVTFVAGYGTAASDVPRNLKHAIKQLAAFWYWQRDAAATPNSVEPGDEAAPTYREIPFGVFSIVNHFNASGYT